jgi:threonine/homoserine/homoserine lactone efflux protein
MSDTTSINRLPGRLVVLGMLCLFVAMACGLASLALIGKSGGGTLLSLAKVFGFLWLPLVGLGALMRTSDSQKQEQATASKGASQDSSQSGEASER